MRIKMDTSAIRFMITKPAAAEDGPGDPAAEGRQDSPARCSGSCR